MKIVSLLLAFTWELPQTLAALVFMLFFKTQGIVGNSRIWHVHFSSFLTCASLGEFIFFAKRDVGGPSWEDTVRHETGHSVQSRIFGPLYLILIALPSRSGTFFQGWTTGRADGSQGTTTTPRGSMGRMSWAK